MPREIEGPYLGRKDDYDDGVIPGSAVAAFSPSDVAGLKLWLKPETIALPDGTAVGTWTDSSGQGNNATQATAANKPLYKTGIVNGKPVVRFDAVDDGMVTTLSLAVAPFSIFLVYAYNGTIANQRRVIQGSNNWLIGPWSNKYDYFDGSAFRAAAPAAPQGVFKYFSLIVGAANTSYYINGTLNQTSANVSFPATVGLGTGGLNADPAESDVAEVVIYNVDASASRANIENYLKTRFGL